MGDEDLTPRQRLSKRVFNAVHRLDLCLVMLAYDPGVFVAKDELVRRISYPPLPATGIPPTAVHRELHLMAEIHVLQKEAVHRRLYFARIDSPFWEWARELSPATDQEHRSVAHDAS